MTFHALAEQTGLAVNTIKNIAHDLIEELDRTALRNPGHHGIDDEVSIAEVSLRHHEPGDEQRLSDVGASHAGSPEAILQEPARPGKVEWVCTDMWRPFKRSFAQYLPNAKLVIDKFHVVKMASKHLDEERKKYQGDFEQGKSVHVKKSIRWLTLKRPRLFECSGTERRWKWFGNHP